MFGWAITFLIVALIAGLLGWYGYGQLTRQELSFQYFQTLDEFTQSAPTMIGRAARVHGYVAMSSIERDVAGGRVRFAVQNKPPHGGEQPPVICAGWRGWDGPMRAGLARYAPASDGAMA